MLGDLHEVAHQVEELLPRGQRIHQPAPASATVLGCFRCSIRPLAIVTAFPSCPGSRSTTASARSSSSSPVTVRPSSVTIVIGFVSLLDHLRRVEDRFDQLNVGHVLADRGQIGAKGRGCAGSLGDVAPGARESRLVENQRTPADITQPASLSGQRRGIFAAQLRLNHPRRGNAVRAGDQDDRQENRRDKVTHQIDLSRVAILLDWLDASHHRVDSILTAAHTTSSVGVVFLESGNKRRGIDRNGNRV